MPRYLKSSKRAFTLLELLVVVAIIALLAAILFPAFSRARENARRSSCASNVKQLALGILQYTQDYDETLPPVAYPDPTDTEDQISWASMTAPYLKSEQIFKCPSDSKSDKYSYGLNELAFVDWVDDTPDEAPAFKLSQFQNTTQTVMLGDIERAPDVDEDALKMVEPGDDLDDELDGLPLDRHMERVNLAFMDGHVKAMRLDQFYEGQTPADKFFTP
jgi:prepilin-type N-terminal cleavage/methylation domain-containing protein/prepilin-type processing-associated H-X9-DG protein